MKTLIYTCFFALLLLAPNTANATELGDVIAEIEAAKAKQPAEQSDGFSVAFLNEAQEKITLNDFKGKIVLLNFWATWCPPCIKEMPAMDKLQKNYQGQGLEVVAVSQDFGGIKTVERFYERANIKHLPIYMDQKNTLFTAFKSRNLPYTIVFDRYGNELMSHEGYLDWSDSNLQLKLQQWLLRK